jgi:hypothetical protein
MRYLALTLLALVLACGDDDTLPPLPDAGPFDAAIRDSGRGDSGSTDAAIVVDGGAPDSAVPACNPDGTLGSSCTRDSDCNDGCHCTGRELCIARTCIAGVEPCSDLIRCTAVSCDEETDACVVATDDTACDDGNPCNGREVCDRLEGCLPGFGGADCNDGDSCTIDSCSPATGCAHTIRDLDGDGYPDDRCEGGTDCNDDPLTGVGVHPDAPEVCDSSVDENCDGFADIADPMCVPSNDTCATATFLPGPGTFAGSTIGVAQDHTISCSTSAGFDVVYTFSLLTERNVRIVSESGGPNAIALRPLAECATGTGQISCISGSSGTATITAPRLAAGDYAIVVKTTMEETFDLTLEVTPVGGAAFGSEACDAAATDISGGGVFTGDFTTLRDDHPRSTCQSTSASGVDAAYRLELAVASDVTLRTTVLSTSGFSTTGVTAVLADCSMPTTEVSCRSVSGIGETVLRGLRAGSYWVIVAPGTTTAAGEYSLEAIITPMPPPIMGDDCGSAVDVTDTSVSIPMERLTNQGGLSCGGSSVSWVDAFFSFTLTRTSNVALSSDAGGLHLLSVGTGCRMPATDFVCRAGTPSIEQDLTLAAGTYYIGVSVPVGTPGMLTVGTTTTPVD